MSATLTCREAVERLWGYLDDDLHPTDHGALEAHLQLCLRCCGELAFAREVRRLLRERTGGGPPAEVRGRLEAFIDGLGEGPARGTRSGARRGR